MKVVLRAVRLGLGAAVFAVAAGGCYAGGGGTDPPTDEFYFPAGLAVSAGGNVLYAVNSDFDLQWSGGTLQAYDLHRIRRDAAVLTNAALQGLPFPNVAADPGPGELSSSPVDPSTLQWPGGDGGIAFCYQVPPLATNNGTIIGLQLGTNCAPPMDSTAYQTSSAVMGAFATDLQLSKDGARLFAPVRGSATVTWADVGPDSLTEAAPASIADAKNDERFQIDCGQGSNGGRCASMYETGDDPFSPANTRNVTMPGEPFGLAQSEDGTVMVVTSQTNTQSSLLTTGIGPQVEAVCPELDGVCPDPNGRFPPTMQFVAGGVANGGNGIAVIPHDPDVVQCPIRKPGQVCVQPAFLQTSRDVAEMDLLRYYSDDGSTLHRPYIQVESRYTIPSNSGGGVDSRGIAIDATQRLACKALGKPPLQCGEIPARVFFANRSANVLATATVGGPSLSGDGNYNPDLLTFTGNIPVSNGPSRVYIAPVVIAGKYEVRVFVVCFDSNQLVIYDPNANVVENVVDVGVGPFAMAFDPFDMTDVATNAVVPTDPRYTDVSLRTYRYAYIASFTQSYVQVLDLDDTPPPNSGLAGSATFEQVVFTVGNPTPPIGSNQMTSLGL